MIFTMLLLFAGSCSIEDATEEIFQPLTVLVDGDGGAWHRTGLDLNRNGILDDTEITSSVFIPDGVDGTDGEDGYSTMIRVTPGDGGYTISFGLDTDRDGELGDNEITDSIFIANGVDGEDGHNSLVRTEITDDGHIIYIGLDTNNDGILQDSEVTSQIKVLNGTNGTNGEDGTNGTNGLNLLIHIVELHSEMEHNCEYGGVRVYYGLDDNSDGVLDANEYDGYHDVCECVCECDNPVPYYEIEPICCDDYNQSSTTDRIVNTKVICEVTGFKVTKGIVGKPELETVEIFCN